MNQIVKFSVENFLSFCTQQVLTFFSTSDLSLEEYLITIANEKFKLLPVSAIYGANSSGKTNLINAIGFLKFLLITNSNRKVNDSIPFMPFKLTSNRPTTFEIIFISEGIRYEYVVKFNEKRVIMEKLYTYPKGKPKKVFEREYNEETKEYKYSYSREYQTAFKDIESKSLSNKFYLATLAEWSEVSEIKDPINFFQNKIVINTDYSNPNWLHYTAEQLSKKEEIREMFLKLLKEINPTIKDIKSEVIKRKVSIDDLPSELPIELKMLMSAKEHVQTDIKIIYEFPGLELDLSEESRGIKKLFEIGGPLLEILLKGKILIFDELETSLHPLLARKIIELFLNTKYNKNGAQLLFTTHDTNLLDLNFLRRDQIWITEKGSETNYSTQITSLAQIKGVRKDENIQKGFLQGKYTKVPFLTGEYLDKLFDDE